MPVPSTHTVEAGGSETQSHPQAYGEFEVSLGSMGLCLDNKDD